MVAILAFLFNVPGTSESGRSTLMKQMKFFLINEPNDE